MIEFFDVTAEVAHSRSEQRRQKTGDPPIPLEYLRELRRAYYIQIRSLALNGQARIIYIYNEPFCGLQEILTMILTAPSARVTRDIFVKSKELTFESSHQEVTEAFRILSANF
jgi:hypothetical protein